MRAARFGNQSGAVLILVLWITALLAVLLGAFSLSIRVERSVGGEVVQQVRSRAAGDAVLNYLAALRRVDEDVWVGMVGEVLRLPWRDSEVDFRFIPEASFVSLNDASAAMLTTVFAGLEVDQPERAAQAILEHRKRRQGDGMASGALPWGGVEELLTLGHGLERLEAPERFFSADSRDSTVVLDFAAPELREILTDSIIQEAGFESLNDISADMLTIVLAGLEVDQPERVAQAILEHRNRKQGNSMAGDVLPRGGVEELLTLGPELEALVRFFSADSPGSTVALDFAAPELREVLANIIGVIEGESPLPQEPEMFRVQVVFGVEPEVRKAEFTVVFEEEGIGFRLVRSHLFAARFDWSDDDATGHE